MSTLTLEPQVHPDTAIPAKSITPPNDAAQKTMRVLIAGASGMIGSLVAPYLARQGDTIVRLVRHAPGVGEVHWDSDAVTIDAAGIEGFDGVVHVASRRLASQRLIETGYEFRFAKLEAALRHELALAA